MAKIDEVKEADLKEGRDLPPFAFLKLGDRAAVFGSPRMMAGFIASKRGNPSFAHSDGWKLVSSRPLVVGIDMMAVRKLTPPDEGAQFKHLGFGPIWDETETVSAGITLGKKADLLVAADCLGEKGTQQVRETTDAGAILVRNMLREVRTVQLRRVADNLGARKIEEPEFVQFLFDAADKALSNVKVKQEAETNLIGRHRNGGMSQMRYQRQRQGQEQEHWAGSREARPSALPASCRPAHSPGSFCSAGGGFPSPAASPSFFAVRA